MTQEILEDAVQRLRNGEVVGVPTDTVYGLAVDPWSEGAVSALYELKGRPRGKPIGLLAGSIDQVEAIVELGPGRDLARHHWPGALTLVVRPHVLIPDWIGDSAVGTVGIRVPDHPLLLTLLGRMGPLAVTSANTSGGEESLDEGGAREAIGDDVGLYIPGRCPGGAASTVVDVTGPEPTVLRHGPIVVPGSD